MEKNPLPYDRIEVGQIYEYSVLDTVYPVEILSVQKTKVFPKDSSSTFISFELLDLIHNKKFKTGIETGLLETLSEECKNYIFKFFPPGTLIEGLKL